MLADDGVGVGARAHHRVPRVVEDRREADLVRALGERHRHDTTIRVATDLGRGLLGVGEVGDAERDQPVWVLLPPLLDHPVVVRAGRCIAELRILRGRVHPPAETGDHRREVDRGPDAAEVHVLHALVDVVATGPHLVEAERLESVAARSPAGDGVHAGLVVRIPLELPDLVTAFVQDDLRRTILQLRGEPALEHVRRLDEVVVDRDHGVLHRRRFGLGKEELGVQQLRHGPQYAAAAR